MKLFFTLMTLLISTSALADTTATQTSLPEGSSEVSSYDAVLDQGVKNFAVEVGFEGLGDYGTQSYRTFSSSSTRQSNYYEGTDGALSITVRKAFSTDFDLSLSGTVLNATASTTGQTPDNTYMLVSMKPFSLGARYHQSYFSDAIRPFAQVDLGEAAISETYFTNGYVGDTNSYFRPFAKLSLGSDFFVSPKLPVYLGVKMGYLVMSEFGGFTTGVDIGYAF